MSKLVNNNYEMAILGGIMSSRKILEDNESLIKEELFYEEENKIIAREILDLYKKEKPVDLATVADSLRKKDLLKYIGGMSYLTSLCIYLPSKSVIEPYLEELENLAYKRLVVEASESLIEGLESGDDINTCLDKFERATERLDTSEEDNTLRASMEKIFNDINEGKPINKVKTGIPIVDKHTNGLAPGELVAIGAKSGVGKSALAVRIAINMFKADKKVLIVSREMSKQQVTERIILSHSGISKEAYENRDFSDQDWVRIVETMEAFSTDKIIIDDKISTIAEKHK